MTKVKKIINILFVLSLVLFGVSFFFRNTLPDSGQVSSELYSSPRQEKAEKEPIILEKENYTATIEPLFSYEIYGLIVTQYDSDIWYDQTHKDDPFNTKDLCVVWGNNAESGVYKKGEYRHGEFSCHWNFKNYEDYSKFSYSEISNNHIIPSSDEIMKEIKSTHIGDQVHIKGYLSNYSVDAEGRQIFTRGTSTTREDTGSHACETIYVTDFDIIKRNNNLFLLIWQYGRYITGVLFLILVILFFANKKEYSAKE